MDGFTGYKTAVTNELATAVTVLDPFHVVKLAADALDDTRRRVQQATRGHRGRAGDPLYRARRTLLTGQDLLTDKQKALLASTFGPVEHTEVEVTWAVYQAMITAYRNTDRAQAKKAMQALIAAISSNVPAALVEVRRLGRTLHRRADDVLAYFDRPGTSNGPTEAIIPRKREVPPGRLEHLRGTALGFRNLTHYITRSLLETGGFRPQLHPGL